MSRNLSVVAIVVVLSFGGREVYGQDLQNKMYFAQPRDCTGIAPCDQNDSEIWRMNLDGTGLERVVVWRDGETPMAFDIVDTYLYWVNVNGSGCIYRAGLEIPEGETAETRSDIECVYQEDFHWFTAFTIDHNERKMYWMDNTQYERANLDGSGQEVIAQLPEVKPVSNGGAIWRLPSTGNIPAVSQWGLIVMALLLLTIGTMVIERRRVRAS